MMKILFVDDEQNVLEGLQRMLRPMRHEWELAFATDGGSALDKLAQGHFDVVVSDMRMPGMNGAELLTRIREHYPHIVRIILSGYADEEATFKSLGPAHQFLSKPSSAEAIKMTVSRTCALRDLLANERLQLLVSQMQSLPSLPSLYAELIQELQSPEASFRKVAEIISSDLGMTAKILQMVNSAFFGVRRHISSPFDAVNLLGLNTVMTLVLSIQVFSQFDQKQLPGFSPKLLWAHSMRVGLCAKKIAQVAGGDAEVMKDAFTAGLLHDAGHLVLAANMPYQYAQALELAQSEGIPDTEAERHIFGATHPEVGAYLFGLWGLPHSIIEAVAYHHHPSDCPAEGFTTLTAVHIGEVMALETQSSNLKWVDAKLDMNYLGKLGLAEELEIYRDACSRVAEEEAA
jgi:HD-like signal output (HDOD) protein